MFLVNWFWNVLSSLGLYNKEGKLLLLGLDNAGKTTLLHRLKENRMSEPSPTFHPTSEHLKIDNVTFTTHDLGGHVGARKLWKNYFPDVSGILYMVDAADQDRFAEAKTQLDLLLQEEELAHVPFAIIGNKIDLAPGQLCPGHPGACSEHELRMHLGLTHTTEGEDPQPGVKGMGLFMSSVNKEIGYQDAFQWIAKYM